MLNGDMAAIGADAPFLSIGDGIIKQAKASTETHKFKLTGTDYKGTIFPSMLGLMPNKIKNDRRNMCIYCSSSVADTYIGQVRYEKFEQLVPVGDGNDPVNDGHIVFYADEWQSSGGAIGDEIKLEDSSRLIVIEVKPMAHYRRKYHRVHVYFSRKRTK